MLNNQMVILTDLKSWKSCVLRLDVLTFADTFFTQEGKGGAVVVWYWGPVPE
jgi:hypothetical protein